MTQKVCKYYLLFLLFFPSTHWASAPRSVDSTLSLAPDCNPAVCEVFNPVSQSGVGKTVVCTFPSSQWHRSARFPHSSHRHCRAVGVLTKEGSLFQPMLICPHSRAESGHGEAHLLRWTETSAEPSGIIHSRLSRCPLGWVFPKKTFLHIIYKLEREAIPGRRAGFKITLKSAWSCPFLRAVLRRKGHWWNLKTSKCYLASKEFTH